MSFCSPPSGFLGKTIFYAAANPWRRRWLLVALATGFWCGIYYVVRRVLLYFQSVYDLGPSLAYQLLLIILLTFLSMLLFSNLITALSTFFLARDLDLLLSTPVSTGSFYYSRLITTILNSSWMVLFLACRSLRPTARSSAAESCFTFGWRSSCPSS